MTEQKQADKAIPVKDQPTHTQLIELPEERRAFGGNKDAINKHSQRQYDFVTQHGNHRILLDLTLDGVPPFYSAFRVPDEPNQEGLILLPMRVGGFEYWGDGMPWRRAEKLLKESLDYKYRNDELSLS